MTYARTPKAPLFATLIAALAATAQRAAAADPVYEAGPIWNQGHAGQVCPAVAASHGGEWTGQWWTTVWGRMSVCQVRLPARTIEAGPIWNQGHAEQVCPAVAASHGGEWTGQWWTTVWGRMSVCQVR